MAEPVSLELAKAQLRILDDEGEDALITSYIGAAREWVESFTRLALVPKTIIDSFDRFGWIALSAWPVQSVTSVSYVDGLGTGQDLGDARALLATRPVRIVPAIGSCWPRTYAQPGAVTVTYEAGYASAEAVPASVRQAMLMLVEHWFRNRGTMVNGIVGEIPFAVDALLRPYRLPVIG